jgi:DNA-binding CsgD family transcriptional regulator
MWGTLLLLDSLLLVAVEAIYDAAPDPQKWPAALAAIADCFGDVGAILLWRRDDGAFGTIASPSLAEAQKDYEQNWATRDFKAMLAEQKGLFLSGEPFSDCHLCSEEETRSQPFFQDFLCRHGLGWFGSIAVSPDPHIGVTLVVQRNTQRHQYSDAELEVIRTIGRHIEKSLRLSLRLLDAELANLGLGEALSRIGIGVFALDGLGRVIFSNPSALRLLGVHFAIEHDQLHIRRQSQRRLFSGAISQMLRAEGNDRAARQQPFVLHGDSSSSPLVVYLLPVAAPPRLAEQFLTHTRAIVLAIEPIIGEPADPALVRDVFGLTLGEARVAALIGSGLPPRETAERLGIAEETARNHLKRVFSKIGVSRQSELTALLSKLVVR